MARQTGPLRARLEYAAVGALAAPLRMLERERAVRLGARLGALAMGLDRIDRPVAMRNLGIAFPAMSPGQRLAVLRATYENWGRMLAEWMHFPSLDRNNIERFATYRNIENWRRAEEISQGRGILILTGHFGNFEFLILAHSIYGNRVAVVHRPLRNPLIDAAVLAARTRFGNRVVPRKGAGRDVIRLLRQNWMVGIPLDLDVRHGVFVDFFSLKASTSDALARLALATGAPVVPAFMVRDGTGTHHWLECLEPLEPLRGAGREESVQLNTQRYTAIIEEMIRRHPDHWNWIHRRWKTRPPGEQRFY
ncbi:MAG TPA: lysophospholipid acyltransferase family protein [Candidatus Binataceae bacterium]|nr:lysophospholipid acyltransferase family protein [Candidatus Binataceae bacterium]